MEDEAVYAAFGTSHDVVGPNAGERVLTISFGPVPAADAGIGIGNLVVEGAGEGGASAGAAAAEAEVGSGRNLSLLANH